MMEVLQSVRDGKGRFLHQDHINPKKGYHPGGCDHVSAADVYKKGLEGCLYIKMQCLDTSGWC